MSLHDSPPRTDHAIARPARDGGGRGVAGNAEASTAPDATVTAGMVPAWQQWLFRVGTYGLLAFYFFFVYCHARTLTGDFGLSLSTVVVTCVATAAMAAMVVFLIGLPELPEVFHRHVIPMQRHRRELCPNCGYSRRGSPGHCPECGHPAGAPARYQLTLDAVRRFAWIVGLGWLTGVVLGEAWMLRDESVFRAESAVVTAPGGVDVHRRQRVWPCSHAWLQFSTDGGFRSEDPFTQSPIADWEPVPPRDWAQRQQRREERGAPERER